VRRGNRSETHRIPLDRRVLGSNVCRSLTGVERLPDETSRFAARLLEAGCLGTGEAEQPDLSPKSVPGSKVAPSSGNGQPNRHRVLLAVLCV